MMSIGWSAGGSIALQVAKCLEIIPGIQVVGILMVDSPFPDFPDWRPRDQGAIKFHIPASHDQSEKNRLAQEQSVNDIIQALAEWKVPSWTARG